MERNVLIVLMIALCFGLLLSGCSMPATGTALTTANSEELNDPIKTTTTEEIENSIATTTQDIREVAYNQLAEENKARVSATWQDGTVSKITLIEGRGIIEDKSYIGKEVYMIDFPTNEISIPNNIVIYLAIDTNIIIGYGLVD